MIINISVEMCKYSGELQRSRLKMCRHTRATNLPFQLPRRGHFIVTTSRSHFNLPAAAKRDSIVASRRDRELHGELSIILISMWMLKRDYHWQYRRRLRLSIESISRESLSVIRFLFVLWPSITLKMVSTRDNEVLLVSFTIVIATRDERWLITYAVCGHKNITHQTVMKWPRRWRRSWRGRGVAVCFPNKFIDL